MGNLTFTLTPYQDKLTLSLVERSVQRSLMSYLAGEQAGCSSTRLAAVAPRCSNFTTKAASALSCIAALRSINRSLPPSAHMVDDSRVEPTISSSLRYFITASSRVFYPRVDSISVVKYGIKQRIEFEYLDYCAERRWQGLSALSSGNSSALLRRRPLRTGHESRPSSGSSLSSAPWSGTGQSINVYRRSTSGKVRRPRRIKGIGCTAYFDVPND